MLQFRLKQLGHFNAGAGGAGDRHGGVLVDLKDLLDGRSAIWNPSVARRSPAITTPP
jgi:hypothetical protein